MANKYEYLYVVQGHYNSVYGWEDLTSSKDHSCALADLVAYNRNEVDYLHRLVFRRVPLEVQLALSS